MILRPVHEAHGKRSANVLVSGSGPLVLWTLGGGSKANLTFQTCLALRGLRRSCSALAQTWNTP